MRVKTSYELSWKAKVMIKERKKKAATITPSAQCSSGEYHKYATTRIYTPKLCVGMQAGGLGVVVEREMAPLAGNYITR